MKAVTYYLTLPLFYLISYLPFWWLYRLSDFVFVILFYVFGYRKKVVMKNLQNSFPEKTEAELKTIQRKFYRYLCDLMLETIKTMTISPDSLRKRIAFKGEEIYRSYFEKGQSVIIALGHFGNWELAGARFAIEPLHQLFIIYHPLSNKYFDGLIYKMRTRLGNGLYAMKETIRSMVADRKKLTATAFIADQTPSAKSGHWMTFLNQDTPVFTGMGKIASKLEYPIIYMSIKRTKRGYYEMAAEKLVPDPSKVSDIEIIEIFTKRLEQDIKEMPEIWLWTHRRWKHKRELSIAV